MNVRVRDNIKEFDDDGLVLLMTIKDKWSEEIWGYLEKSFLKNIDNLSDKIFLRGLRSLVKSKRVTLELWGAIEDRISINEKEIHRIKPYILCEIAMLLSESPIKSNNLW